VRRRFLLAIALLLCNGCANCGKEEQAAPASNPEPPVVLHPKLPDGGRGKAKIVDLSERGSLFDSGPTDPP
jgi:hypothetical protein